MDKRKKSNYDTTIAEKHLELIFISMLNLITDGDQWLLVRS